jgi:hypothetical protein
MIIANAEGTLRWPFRDMAGPLAHRHDDTCELPEAPGSPGGLLPGELTLLLSSDRDANVASLAVPLEPFDKDIAFTRIAAGECTLL